MNPQGFGYVVNESGDGRGDLYVAAENQSTAMHRDRVVARIIRDRVPLNAEAGNERKQGALDLDILEVACGWTNKERRLLWSGSKMMLRIN